jgi:hypothetical protein
MATPDPITPIAATHSPDTDVEKAQVTNKPSAPRAPTRAPSQGKVPDDAWLTITDVDFCGKNQTVHKTFTASRDDEDEVNRALDSLPKLAKGPRPHIQLCLRITGKRFLGISPQTYRPLCRCR